MTEPVVSSSSRPLGLMLLVTVGVVVGLIEPCGKLNGKLSGFPDSSKKLSDTSAEDVPRFTTVRLVSQPPADATCAIEVPRFCGRGLLGVAEVTSIATDCVVEAEAVSVPVNCTI